MAQNLNDPQRVAVTTEISFEEALQAVEYFVEKYPAERLSDEHAFRLGKAACSLASRVYNQEVTLVRWGL